ncbi:MAG: pilus assembly protein PilF [Betaproteobacteria bacterium]|nr:pilus assembly protein PilF [Betaproteobacteria bacterium]
MFRRPSAFLLLLGILLCLIYAAGLYGGFFFDDTANLLLSDGVRLGRLDFGSLSAAWHSGAAGLGGRPLAQLTFALGFYVSGFDPFAFKLTNLAIHWGNACLVFMLATRVGVSLGLCERGAARGAMVSAALWALHPLQLTTVLFVVQRMTSLSALFVLGGLLLHLAGRERSGWTRPACLATAWLICWPLACFSKETAILFPFYVLVWEVFVRPRQTGAFDRGAWAIIVGVVLSSIVALGYLVSDSGAWLWAGYDFRPFTLTERLLTQARVIWFYLGLIFFPRNSVLGLYHDDFGLSGAFLEPWTTLPAILGILALVMGAWRIRKAQPVVAFALAWFLFGHLVESTVLPLELAYEHRNYLPSVGIAIAIGVLISRAVSAGGGIKRILFLATGVLVVTLSATTAARAYQFGDDLRRTQTEALNHESSPRAQYEAGLVLMSIAGATSADAALPAYAAARHHFKRAMALDPAMKSAGLGIIRLDCLQGQQPSAAMLDEIVLRLTSKPFAPGDTGFFFSLKELGAGHAPCPGRVAIDTLFQAGTGSARVAPQFKARIHSWHADYLWLVARDRAAALSAIDQSLALVPWNASNRLKRAQLQYLGGEDEREAAVQEMRQLLSARLLPSERALVTQLLAAAPGAPSGR